MPHLFMEKMRHIFVSNMEIYRLKKIAARQPALLPAIAVAMKTFYFMSILDASRIR